VQQQGRGLQINLGKVQHERHM